ncbi:MAG TPA: hypothetical protein VJI46_03675 [Candidatus Nanoarchaeia archaeon]|nr:hypothetical protein [Candidatus Nanoarchaeia archaeon]
MDFIAHGFWSYIIFHKTKKPLYAVLFGLLPDIISWGPYMVYRLFTDFSFGKPVLEKIPDWVYTLYGVGHSIFVWALIIAIIYFINKKYFIYTLAAPIEIIIDAFTHSREFLPTPFLWPVSEWTFPGISWGQWWFMLINYVLIVVCMIYILRKKRKG